MTYNRAHGGWKRRAVVGAAAFAVLAAVGGGVWGWRATRPNIVRNETQAIVALRLLISAQASWRQNDPDGNGQQDFWTADLYGMCFHRDKSDKPVQEIPAFLAGADRFPVRGGVRYAEEPPAEPRAHHGFFFEILRFDQEGKPYAQDDDGDGFAGEHPARFGFRAIPERYGVTGINMWQTNEEGVIYGRDAGSGAEAEPAQGSWDGGADPTTGSPPWRVV